MPDTITELEWLEMLLAFGEKQMTRWLCIYHPLLPAMSDKTGFACECEKILLPSTKFPFYVNGFAVN